ncbi:hypothetical protein HOY82DRAFT_603156 [Tuber indicum]|nr:hypothetical protein HOY82DRAFT_603156 [Tuber indicum]
MLPLLVKRAHMARRLAAHQPLGCRRFLSGSQIFHQQSKPKPNQGVSDNDGSQQQRTPEVDDRQAINIDKLDLDVFIVERGAGTSGADFTKNIRDLCSRMGVPFTSTEPIIAKSDPKVERDTERHSRELKSEIVESKPGIFGEFWRKYGPTIGGFCTAWFLGGGYLAYLTYAMEHQDSPKMGWKEWIKSVNDRFNLCPHQWASK